jgi:hypothetical protein
VQKKFDAVKFQREARATLSREYLGDREAFLKELANKYGKPKQSEDRGRRQSKSAVAAGE